jgi:hypothetical protein
VNTVDAASRWAMAVSSRLLNFTAADSVERI